LEINNSLKLKLFAVLFLSNCSTAMFFSHTEKPLPKNKQNFIVRSDYIVLRINADLKTKFTMSEPVNLTDKNRRNVIKNVFLMERIQDETKDFLEQTTSQFLVEIPKKDFKKLQSMKGLEIYPYQVDIRVKNKRKTHEIIF
jgi:hypothetical protein